MDEKREKAHLSKPEDEQAKSAEDRGVIAHRERD